MAQSIRDRLAHPRISIDQGLPTAKRPTHFRAGESTRFITPQMRQTMEKYLESIPSHHANHHTFAQHTHLYENLTIVDSKAQALLSFNSFLLAIVGIYFGTIQSIRDEIYLLVPFLVTVIASGTSCLLCLDVVWVHWLTAKDMEGVSEQDARDRVTDGFLELLLLRDERTRTYRLAWLISFCSVGSVILGVLAAIFVDLI